MVWANAAAVTLWGAVSRAELCSRDFSVVSESTRTRNNTIMERLKNGEAVVEQQTWTFYPNEV